MVTAIVQITQFQSTPPVKAATRTAFWSGEVRVISIHAAREGGDDYTYVAYSDGVISIHAAREGGDQFNDMPRSPQEYFNPRRP